MRSILAVVLAMLAPGAARAACALAPMPETPTALRNSFGTRMKQLGAGEWAIGIETPRGTMYSSKATLLQFFTKDADGQTEETGLILPAEGTASDAARMETAATFLAAHISGSAEGELKTRVVYAIADTRKNGTVQAIREGDTVLMLSSPEPGAVALVAGRMRCR